MTEKDARTSRLRSEAATASRFALVGIAATLTHSVVALAALQSEMFGAYGSNILGFIVAFVVSFAGHNFWSFKPRRHHGTTGRRMARFLLIAVMGFLANNVVLTACLQFTNWPATVGLIFSIAIVPVLSFLGSRFWAFSGSIPAFDT
ncbi:putative GtrA family protein [Roseibium sp. TrichSKD4]|uniref:GtrA family protein n=1 Tax=Roseibium sp. TrichSKD4 TaxID=744980 RepID=UPI0001E5656B|nr:GtrA family protein [Roseibium sp. TrichSKD4]EFO33499.1 putative GtrA family protein [Roseibium sp. TrichSKD4]